MLVAAIALSVFACIDRGDPTSPGDNSGPADGVTIAVRLPVTSLEVGHVVTAAATATNSAGQSEAADTIEWSSSDTSIFVVSAAGQITARKMGAGSIYAKWRRHSGKGTLTVTDTLPTKVVVTPASVSEGVGSSTHLAAAVSTRTGRALPGHTVKWSSTNTSYVTVSPTGMTTGVKTGSAMVIASTTDVADTSVVTISPAAISALSVSPNNTTLGSGKTLQLTAQAVDAAGNELTGRTVGWSSSDEDIASVSTGGMVTGGKVGSATITATSEGLRATATIKVGAGGIAAIDIAPGSVGLVAGKTQQLAASLEDDAGNALPAQSLDWSSANSGIATVSSTGLVTAVHTGNTIVSASANGVSGKASVVVSAGAVKSVVVTPASLTLANGATQQLSAKLTDASGNAIDDDAAWSSSNSSVATVSSTGLVTAKRAGSATITAAAGGASDVAAVTVTAGSVSAIGVTPGSNSLVSGDTQQLTAKLTDASGSVITGQTVTWASSNSSVVSVSSSGLATAAKTGSATVTATAGGVSGSAAFAVAAGAVNTITITPASGSMVQGKTLQLAATFQDVAGNTVTGSTVTWASSSSSVASISSGGLITGVAVGSATITATSGGKSKTAAITVTAAVSSAPPPPPAPAPPPPPPPVTTPIQTACSAFPHARVVGVSTSAELHSALSGAKPGDLIQMADGTYGDGNEFRLLVGGSQSARITLCGTANAVINTGSLTARDGLKLDGANYVTLSGFTITNALFGLYVTETSHAVIQGLTIHAIGQEAIALKEFSKGDTLASNKIYDTGRVVAEYGEAIYIGSTFSTWSGGIPDASDSVVIINNTFGPDVRAEHIDAKEGTHGGMIRGNTFNGTGMVESQGSGESGWPNSWVILQGVGYHVDNNTGSNALSAGFRVVTHGTVQTGLDNSFSGNSFDVGGAAYGFLMQAGSSTSTNDVMCDNTVRNASKAMSNVACK